MDGRLAVDLGGIGPKRGGVDLDALGLMPGRQYTLALFTARRYMLDPSVRCKAHASICCRLFYCDEWYHCTGSQLSLS